MKNKHFEKYKEYEIFDSGFYESGSPCLALRRGNALATCYTDWFEKYYGTNLFERELRDLFKRELYKQVVNENGFIDYR